MKTTVWSSFTYLPFLALFASSTVCYAQARFGELDDGTTFGGVESRALELQNLGGLADGMTDEEVYWVAYWHSDTPSTNRSASVITTGNTSQQRSCVVTVDWFAQGGQPENSTTVIVPPRQARDHCSRSVPGSVTVCNAVRVPVQFIEGFAIITTQPQCSTNIAADARVYHTVGTEEVILGAQNVKIIRLPRGNRGD